MHSYPTNNGHLASLEITIPLIFLPLLYGIIILKFECKLYFKNESILRCACNS